MNHVIRAPQRVRHLPRLRLLQVARAETLTPRMRRITLAGDALDGFVSAAPDDHVKLFFPVPGGEKPNLPTFTPNGLMYAEGVARPAVRDYTPRYFDTRKQELAIDFVLHGDGPASSWASQAAPGHWLGVGGPKSSRLSPDDYDTYLFAGDETALPAIARHLEALRAGTTALVLLEVADAREERYLPSAANTAVTWLYRHGAAAGHAALLQNALKNLLLPTRDIHAWLAGEIDAIRELRRTLMEEEGIPRAQIQAAGYWRRGAAGAHSRIED